LSWLLENKGGYYSLTTQGLDFYADDLTQELLEEGLIEKSEEYARGGVIGDYAVILETGDLQADEFVKYRLAKGIMKRVIGSKYGVAEVEYVGSKEALKKMIDKFWSDLDKEEYEEIYNSIYKYTPTHNFQIGDKVSWRYKHTDRSQHKGYIERFVDLDKVRVIEDYFDRKQNKVIKKRIVLNIDENNMKSALNKISNENSKFAKGGNINSKTNKKMATKKVKDGQSAPQTKRWIFAFNKGGYNYYNEKEVPYKKAVDADKKGAPVGYRFSKYAEEKGITNNRFRKPTKSEVEQYAGKKKNGKLIMYRETRSNKSDVNPKKKI